MAELESQYERKLTSWSGVRFWTMLFSIIAANVLRDLGVLPYIAGYAVASVLCLMVECWVPPKPPVSFPIWVIKVSGYLVPILFGFWLIPILLSRWIWTPLAYGIPAFIVTLFMYWMPPLYPTKRRDVLWKWLLFAIGAAILYGWVISVWDK